jgi:16S rRNA (guanine966-N2)-methyltransferase
MTRIVAGRARGRVLRVPRGAATRPTSDRVREALFSRLEHEGAVLGGRVLDLYAGSGALGLEAASRGAEHVLLVDSAPAAVAVCRRNAADLGLAGVQVRAATAASVLASRPDEPYDLVLVDPPYDLAEPDLAMVLRRLDEAEWLAPGAVVVVERSARSPEPTWPTGLVRFDDRRYGETRLWLAEPPAPDEPA